MAISSRSCGHHVQGHGLRRQRITSRTILFLFYILISSSWVVMLARGTQLFSFQSFSDMSQFVVMGDAELSNGTVVLNSGGASVSPGTATTGRVFYKDSVHLQNNATKRFASFSTTANIAILRGQDSCWGADGMAFVIAGDMYSPPSWDAGGYLGLLNQTDNNGNDRNQIFAIEIDTWKNNGTGFNDPSFCHMAALVNSMQHNASWTLDYCQGNNESWCMDNCVQYPASSLRKMVLQVDYSSDNQVLTATFTDPTYNLIYFSLRIMADLTQVFYNDNLYIGFSGSTHTGCAESHRIYNWTFTTSFVVSNDTQNLGSPNSGQQGNLSSETIAGIVVGVVVLFFLLILIGIALLLCRGSKHGISWKEVMKSGMRLSPTKLSLNALPIADPGWPREFSFQELRAATKNFSSGELLGKGGFGSVYKGQLGDTGAFVAVKMISPEKFQKGGEREFLAEVSIISQIHHRNLVTLQGWCYDNTNMLLVYDYMPNGSLDRLLRRKTQNKNVKSSDQSVVLPWHIRFKTVNGVAAALSYLHGECGKCILHRDVKPSNVLLDGEFNAYLADFGLARLFDHDLQVAPSMTFGGTPGYLAPELSHSGKATTKTDVYSFGVLALEVASGRRPREPNYPEPPIILIDWVWAAQEAGDLLRVADPDLRVEFNENEMTRLLHIGLLCCDPDPNNRLNMMLARQMLMGLVALPDLPNSQPNVYSNYNNMSKTIRRPSGGLVNQSGQDSASIRYGGISTAGATLGVSTSSVSSSQNYGGSEMNVTGSFGQVAPHGS